MNIQVFRQSILHIPKKPGTYWVKAEDSKGSTVTVVVEHSPNVYESVRLVNKSMWIKSHLQGDWVEVLLDEDEAMSA